jgi:hypothetical protein
VNKNELSDKLTSLLCQDSPGWRSKIRFSGATTVYAAKWGGQKEMGAGGEETGQMHMRGEVYVTCRDMGRE